MPNRASAITRWLVISQPNAQAPMRMFCFPYAGGSATIYQRWPEHLPKQVEICSVQYPGRGVRLREPAFRHLAPLVESLAEAITPYLDKPFAFFGHSLGALLSFELARYLRKQHGLSPIHLFLSGLGAPQIPVRELARHNLPEAEFIEELHRLKGTPKEVLENPELMRLMIPMLRADFSVSATYEYKIEPPLDCPFTVLGGLQDDDVGREMLEGWREQTLSTFSLRMLPGDHFFLHSAQALLLDILHKELHRKYAMISANQKAPARSL